MFSNNFGGVYYSCTRYQACSGKYLFFIEKNCNSRNFVKTKSTKYTLKRTKLHNFFNFRRNMNPNALNKAHGLALRQLKLQIQNRMATSPCQIPERPLVLVIIVVECDIFKTKYDIIP